MAENKLGRDIPRKYANQYGVFEGELAHIKSYKESSRQVKPVKPVMINFYLLFMKQLKKQGSKMV